MRFPQRHYYHLITMYSYSQLLFTVLAVFLIGANAQKFGFGSCPKTSIIQDFDVTKYLGKWYEIAKYPAVFQNGDCTEANYGPVDEHGQVKVLNKEVRDGNTRVVGVRGVATQNKINTSDLQVFLQVPIVGMQQSDYNVLKTDYTNYALVHACRQFLGAVKFEFLWILSRSRTLSPELAAEVDAAMTANGLDKSALVLTRQDSCPNIDALPFRLIA